MWVNSIAITNFRSIEELSLTPTRGINTLVGENNVGKSAIFVAISKALALIRGETGVFGENDLRHGSLGNGLVVKCTVQLDQHEQAQLVTALLPQPLTPGDTAKIQQRFGAALGNPEMTFEWREGFIGSYVKLGSVVVQQDFLSRHAPRSRQRERTGGDLPRLVERLLSPDDSLEIIMESVDRWKIGDGFRRVGKMLSQQFRTFAEFRSRPVLGRSQATESFEGTETASVLLNLKNHTAPIQRRRYATICREFSSFFPFLNIDAVEVTPGSGNADVQFMEVGHTFPIPLSNVGAGLAEMLTLLTNLVGRDGYVFVVEEPELHLHPNAKRRLHQLIRASATRNQIFVITHDPYFVDPDHLDSLTRFWITDAGTQKAPIGNELSQTELGKLKTALKDMAKREMVFARALLLVEDESQQKLLLGFASTLQYDLDSNGVCVVSVDGEDAFPPFIKLVEQFRIPHICLRDKDWGSPKSRPPDHFRALGCELEEFLDNAGLGPLMENAKTKVGKSKPRVAQYVGENASVDQIPLLFRELLADAVKLVENR